MKLIEIEPIEDGVVSFQLSIMELKALRDAVSHAITHSEAQLPRCRELIRELKDSSRDEIYETLMDEGLSDWESLDDLKRSVKHYAKLLPQLYDLSDALLKCISRVPPRAATS